MRCPDCNKFVGLDPQDPEVSIDIDDTGSISGDVRCVLACSECSTELKETTFELDAQPELPEIPEPKAGEDAHEHSFSIEETGCEATESGGGRYKKNMRGFSLDYTITCDGCDLHFDGQLEDSLQASAWDENA